MSSHPPEWQGILDEDETILWQGRPANRVLVEFNSPMEAFLALFFVGFSLFWMWQAMAAPGPFWMFGLLFLGVGLYNLVGQHFWKAHLRKSTFYTLTDKRAFIAKKTAMGQKSLKSYPIRADTALSIEEQKGLSSIYFATEDVLVSRPSHWRVNGMPLNNTSRSSTDIGFELLEEGRDVFALMRSLQAKEPEP